MSFLRAVALCCVALLALTASLACGSSKKAPDPTAAVATVTGDVPPLPTLTDPDSIPLVAQHGQLFDYNLSVPEDWKPGAPTNGLDLFNVPNPAGVDATGQPLRSAYITVACDPPSPPPMGTEYSSLALARYALAATNANANPNRPDIAHADEGSLQPVQVGSLSGATYLSTIKLGPLTGRVEHLYVATPTCAWHVALSIYSPGDETPYFSLFDRIIQTFQPQGAG